LHRNQPEWLVAQGIYNPDFFLKMGFCFRPRKKYLRSGSSIFSAFVRLDQAHKKHSKLSRSSADPGVQKLKRGKKSIFHRTKNWRGQRPAKF
jgi:hypothetical protein